MLWGNVRLVLALRLLFSGSSVTPWNEQADAGVSCHGGGGVMYITVLGRPVNDSERTNAEIATVYFKLAFTKPASQLSWTFHTSTHDTSRGAKEISDSFKS